MATSTEHKRKPIILISPDHPDRVTQPGKRLPDEYDRYVVQYIEHFGCTAVLLPKHVDTPARRAEITKWLKMADGLVVMGDECDPLPQADQVVHPLEYIVYALETIKSNDKSDHANGVRKTLEKLIHNSQLQPLLKPLLDDTRVSNAINELLTSTETHTADPDELHPLLRKKTWSIHA